MYQQFALSTPLGTRATPEPDTGTADSVGGLSPLSGPSALSRGAGLSLRVCRDTNGHTRTQISDRSITKREGELLQYKGVTLMQAHLH